LLPITNWTEVSVSPSLLAEIGVEVLGVEVLGVEVLELLD
jgi:hypothetical protein